MFWLLKTNFYLSFDLKNLYHFKTMLTQMSVFNKFVLFTIQQDAFAYHSRLWTNNQSYAVEDGLEGLTEKESKLASYWNTPFKKICLGMTVNGNMKWLRLDYEASSLYSVIADDEFRQTTAGREAWKSLIADSSLQIFCNAEGFSVQYKEFKIRIGVMSNNEDKCNLSDSCIGYGIQYHACGMKLNITCGNIAQCSGNDKGKKKTVAFGYILVQ